MALSAVLNPVALVGKLKRFGEFGPVYEIIGSASVGSRHLIRVRVVESGEEIEYPYDQMLNDPDAL